MRDADDEEIFFAAKTQQAIIITKDIDLKNLLEKYGQPPKTIRLTMGNTSNLVVKNALFKYIDFIIDYLVLQDNAYLEISD